MDPGLTNEVMWKINDGDADVTKVLGGYFNKSTHLQLGTYIGRIRVFYGQPSINQSLTLNMNISDEKNGVLKLEYESDGTLHTKILSEGLNGELVWVGMLGGSGRKLGGKIIYMNLPSLFNDTQSGCEEHNASDSESLPSYI